MPESIVCRFLNSASVKLLLDVRAPESLMIGLGDGEELTSLVGVGYPVIATFSMLDLLERLCKKEIVIIARFPDPRKAVSR